MKQAVATHADHGVLHALPALQTTIMQTITSVEPKGQRQMIVREIQTQPIITLECLKRMIG